MSTPYFGRHRPPRSPGPGVRAVQAGAVLLLTGGLLDAVVAPARADPTPPSAGAPGPSTPPPTMPDGTAWPSGDGVGTSGQAPAGSSPGGGVADAAAPEVGWEPDLTEPRPLEEPGPAEVLRRPERPAPTPPTPPTPDQADDAAATPTREEPRSDPTSRTPESPDTTEARREREVRREREAGREREARRAREAARARTSTPRTSAQPRTAAAETVATPDGRTERATRRTAPSAERRSSRPRAQKPGGHRILDAAASLTGIPYVWGGTSVRGFDCSGYTRHVYGRAGVSLPRTAAQQQRAVRRVRSPKPGDLVFFGSPAHHVGIYAGHGRMYDAPRRGRTTGLHRIWSSNVTYGRP